MKKEFNKYVKNYANNIRYDISNDEIKSLYDYFFDNNNGVFNMMLSSKIQDLIYEKQNVKEKDNSYEF